MFRKIFLTLFALFFSLHAGAQQSWVSYSQVTMALKKMALDYPSIASVRKLATSPGNGEVLLLTIGKNQPDTRPAIAIIANAEGNQLHATQIALEFAATLLTNATSPDVDSLLSSCTFYILPCPNPDAYAACAGLSNVFTTLNQRTVDDDKDGAINEDPCDDLNRDELITWMRIPDPAGKWMPHPNDPRLMVQADPRNGEKGMYRLLTEGTDNDHDGNFNEDGPGGVNLNQNFPFDYAWFAPGAGQHQISEPEAKGIADFLFEAYNVFAVVHLGSGNNLTAPWKFDNGASTAKIITAPSQKDAEVYKQISELYKTNIKLNEPPESGAVTKGDLLQWAYYHYGRFSFGTPCWWVPPAKADSVWKRKGDDKNAEVNLLRYLSKFPAEQRLLDWKPVQHPDFPGQKVEVGGWMQGASVLPPVSLVDSLSIMHIAFFKSLALQMPRVRIANAKTENLGDNLTRVSVDVYNAGLLPTGTTIGASLKWQREVLVEIKTGEGQQLLTGLRKNLLSEPLAAGEVRTFTWLVSGSGTVTIEAGCPQAGKDIQTLNTGSRK